MNLDEVVQTVLAEAAKLIMLQAEGFTSKVGERLLALFRHKKGAPVPDLAWIEQQVVAAAQQDRAWAAEVTEVLAGIGGDRPVQTCAQPPNPFRDRVGLLDKIPHSGVCVLFGRPGSGRSAAVRKVAWERRAEFPAGRLVVEVDQFRRPGGELAITEIQRHILRQCGVDASGQADTVADVASQYRSRMATQRMMLILVGVRGADEIRPFEPTSPVNLVLATTGNLSDDLRTRYKYVSLGAMDAPGARQLLEDKCGAEMLDAEDVWVDELLEICDYLPEPIQFVGEKLDRRRGRPGAVEALVTRLRSTGLRGGVLKDSLDETFAGLAPEIRMACLLLAGHPGFDFDPASASALLGRDAEDTLDALDDAGLLTPTAPGRQRLQHVVRGYALEMAANRDDALTRLLDFLRDCAVYADFEDDEERLRAYPDGAGSRPLPGADLIDYLDPQRSVLLDLVRQAHEQGQHRQVCQLGGALEVLVNKRGGYEWYVALNEIVLDSAELRLREREDEDERRAMVIRAHAMQGRMYSLMHVFDRAEAELRLASEAEEGLRVARPQLTSSLLEFWGRFHQIRAEHEQTADFGPAIAALTEAVRIDERIGDGRALLIHARMLANVKVAAGLSSEAWPLLDKAAGTRYAYGRNLARIHTVRAWAALRSGDPGAAQHWLREARALYTVDGSTQYEWELGELEASIATVTGPVDRARALWGSLAGEACRLNHPRVYRYLAELERLRSPR